MRRVPRSHVSEDRYNIIMSRYSQYLDSCNDVTKDPVNVFDPLSQKSIDELELIREVSRDLQMKKEEDIKKAAQAAQQAEEDAKKEAEKAAEEAKKEEEKEKAESKPEETESK